MVGVTAAPTVKLLSTMTALKKASGGILKHREWERGRLGAQAREGDGQDEATSSRGWSWHHPQNFPRMKPPRCKSHRHRIPHRHGHGCPRSAGQWRRQLSAGCQYACIPCLPISMPQYLAKPLAEKISDMFDLGIALALAAWDPLTMAVDN